MAKNKCYTRNQSNRNFRLGTSLILIQTVLTAIVVSQGYIHRHTLTHTRTVCLCSCPHKACVSDFEVGDRLVLKLSSVGLDDFGNTCCSDGFIKAVNHGERRRGISATGIRTALSTSLPFNSVSVLASECVCLHGAFIPTCFSTDRARLSFDIFSDSSSCHVLASNSPRFVYPSRMHFVVTMIHCHFKLTESQSDLHCFWVQCLELRDKNEI